MKKEKIKIDALDGYKLSAVVFLPEGNPKGCIQINSGTGIPKEFYQNFAIYCAESGYAAITFDYRGIGESSPKRLRGFKATNTDWGQLDISGVFNWCNSHFPDSRKIVFGHSMGGQLIGMMNNGKKIDEIIMITAGIGYWRDMPEGFFKSMMPLLWYIYLPVNTGIFGYASAKKIRQGENLPKGVALEFRRWCINENYWEIDFGKTIDPTGFENITAPITSYIFTDDRIISERANQRLLSYYSNATITSRKISPEQFEIPKIGHFGFFSRKSAGLWKTVIT